MEAVRYRIRRVGRYNFELQRWIKPGPKRSRKTGDGTWIADGYFPRLDLVANKMFERLMLEGKEYPASVGLRGREESSVTALS